MSKRKEPKAVLISNTVHIDISKIPEHVTLNLGQTLLGAVQRAYNDPQFRAEYEQWKAEREQEKNGHEDD